MKFFFHFLLVMLFLTSCEKNEEFPEVTEPNPELKDIIYIENNDIILLPDTIADPFNVTNTPEITKLRIKISHDHQKIAYYDYIAKLIVILNRSGDTLNTITVPYAKSLDWSLDDQTLYYLYDNEIHFFGDSLDCPSIPQFPGGNVIEASISANLDLAYIVEQFSFEQGYTQELKIIAHGSTDIITIENNQNYEMTYVNFSSNESDLTVGYEWLNNKLAYAECYSGLSVTPDFNTQFNFDFFCPIYRSDLKCMVLGVIDSWSYHKVMAWKLNQDNQLKLFYESSNIYDGSSYLDWK